MNKLTDSGLREARRVAAELRKVNSVSADDREYAARILEQLTLEIERDKAASQTKQPATGIFLSDHQLWEGIKAAQIADPEWQGRHEMLLAFKRAASVATVQSAERIAAPPGFTQEVTDAFEAANFGRNEPQMPVFQAGWRAALQSQQLGWLPIETAPKESGLYLVMLGEQVHIAKFNTNTMTPWWRAYGIPAPLAANPTHWQPLPAAPGSEPAQRDPNSIFQQDGLPERDASKPSEQQGLFRKYIVTRTDGSDKPGGKHENCEYFVLDVGHDKHAPAALLAYAKSCKATHPELAADLLDRYELVPLVERVEAFFPRHESAASAQRVEGEAVPNNLLAALCRPKEARGYVAFGAGVYRMQQCTDASLVVTFRNPGEEHYAPGDRAHELDETPIPADDILVRLQFLSAEGLDSLEAQLREIRQAHFPGSSTNPTTPTSDAAPTFDMLAHLERQAKFSLRTFGPGARVEGVTDHIAKELIEVRESGGALSEWVDVVILGLDGAWRSGASPAQIIEAIVAKQTKNEGRNWPDWRTADPGKAIEHDRSSECTATPEQPPVNCRQRLMLNGENYPRSCCVACGKWAPKWRECDAALATAPAAPAKA